MHLELNTRDGLAGGGILAVHANGEHANNLICERCGRGISLQGTWPKGREAKRRAFIDAHRDCGTTTTAREGEEKGMSENDPCRECPERISHLNDCALRTGGDACNCNPPDTSGREWKCGACTSRRFHLSDCAVHNGPALPVGVCDCGLKVSQQPSE